MAEEPRPPYVKFEVRSEEDREASLEAGHYVGKDIVFALVTPAGTRERVEKKADDWIASLEEGVKQERIPTAWLAYYKNALKDFIEQRETPENGYPIRDWPSVNPSQVNTLLDMNIRTVEDLADATEEAVHRLGMGGRALKQKAQAWLDASNKKGKTTEEIANLRQQNAELLARDEEREKQLKTLQAQVEALTQKEEA